MTGNEQLENARTAREARDAIVRRSTAGRSGAEEALKRYLASETIREYRRDHQDVEKAPQEPDEEQAEH
jgi:hypothetical protein